MITRIIGMVVVAAFTVMPATAAPLRTDTSKAVVSLDEIVSGGPPPDGHRLRGLAGGAPGRQGALA